MVVGICRLSLHLPDAHSLKDKRSVVRRLLERLRQRNVAASEVDAHDLWQRAVLGIAVVARDRIGAEKAVRSAVEEAEENSGLKFLDFETDYHHFE